MAKDGKNLRKKVGPDKNSSAAAKCNVSQVTDKVEFAGEPFSDAANKNRDKKNDSKCR